MLVDNAAQAMTASAPDASEAVAMAKAYAGEAGWQVPNAAVQVHGAIGYTWEHDLHLFLRRGCENAHRYASTTAMLDAIGSGWGAS